MSYGPLHNLRCRDEIAAAILGEGDDDSRGPSENDSEGQVSEATRAPDDDQESPSFLSEVDDDQSSQGSVLTGPAASDDQ